MMLLEVQQPFHCAKDKSEGGLALLWMNSLDLHIQTFSPRHIDAVVNSRIDDAWRFTGFYKAPKVANREDSWLILRHLSPQHNLPWVCIGDFNEITKVKEKSGGALRSEKQMKNFRDCVDFCGLKVGVHRLTLHLV